ncbi:hypothetical protein ACO0LG_08755 [Undibacterium sp. Ji42W]|uniref:hypothetical protein n=1 Tax=Undibacterium sp. Ji42W TaxID=3413039 RepID=UPI003BF2E11D
MAGNTGDAPAGGNLSLDLSKVTTAQLLDLIHKQTQGWIPMPPTPSNDWDRSGLARTVDLSPLGIQGEAVVTANQQGDLNMGSVMISAGGNRPNSIINIPINGSQPNAPLQPVLANKGDSLFEKLVPVIIMAVATWGVGSAIAAGAGAAAEAGAGAGMLEGAGGALEGLGAGALDGTVSAAGGGLGGLGGAVETGTLGTGLGSGALEGTALGGATTGGAASGLTSGAIQTVNVIGNAAAGGGLTAGQALAGASILGGGAAALTSGGGANTTTSQTSNQTNTNQNANETTKLNGQNGNTTGQNPGTANSTLSSVDTTASSGLTTDQVKLIANLVRAGVSTAAATAAVTGAGAGSGTGANSTAIIGQLLNVGDDTKAKLDAMYPGLMKNLETANAQSQLTMDRQNGLAQTAIDQTTALKDNFNKTIAPNVQDMLKQNAIYTPQAVHDTQDIAARLKGQYATQQEQFNSIFPKASAAADFASNNAQGAANSLNANAAQASSKANDLDTQWKSYMYPMLQQQTAANAKITQENSTLTSNAAKDASGNTQKTQATWDNTISPMFLAQLEDSKKAANDATGRFNKLADDINPWIGNLQDRMSLSEPLIKKIIQGALDYNEAGGIERQAGLALGDVHSQFDTQRNAEAQKMQSYGIDPTSGRFLGQQNASRVDEAAQAASAATRARDAAVQIGWQRQLDALNASKASNADYSTYAQLAGLQSQNTQSALNAQNSIVDNIGKYNTAANTNANTQSIYNNMMNSSLKNGSDMRAQDIQNVLNMSNGANANADAIAKMLQTSQSALNSSVQAGSAAGSAYSNLMTMVNNYNNSQTSIANAQGGALKTGSEILGNGMSNVNTANNIYNNNNDQILNGVKAASTAQTNAQSAGNDLVKNGIDTSGAIAKNGGTVANIYTNAGQLANEQYKTTTVANTAEQQGYGQLAGTLLNNASGIASGIKNVWDWAIS